MKNRSGLYEYLEASGVLAEGTADEIRMAKEEYWKGVRKEWRHQQRKDCKSYTIFFTRQEVTAVAKAAEARNTSITRFIKAAALKTATGNLGIDQRIIGQVREVLFETYNLMAKQDGVPETALNILLQSERKILGLLGSKT
jgi:uncharacterized protein (DUF1778 family)